MRVSQPLLTRHSDTEWLRFGSGERDHQFMPLQRGHLASKFQPEFPTLVHVDSLQNRLQLSFLMPDVQTTEVPDE